MRKPANTFMWTARKLLAWSAHLAINLANLGPLNQRIAIAQTKSSKGLVDKRVWLVSCVVTDGMICGFMVSLNKGMTNKCTDCEKLYKSYDCANRIYQDE